MSLIECDVAIIGGGPAGATTGCLIKKYNPSLRVVILEREIFPRDHVGESLLPPISPILVEMGCWDKVEAANFPIKIGATLRWGKTPELWNFEFFPADQFRDEPRPAKFEGQRQLTSFQVDRSIYDQILLNHAAECGCEVLQGTRVRQVGKSGNSVSQLLLDNGESVEAKFYVDASGGSGILRKAMGVSCRYPSSLKNIAIWDYWQNAEWAIQIGVGATRIQVRSLGYGWLWFIPLGPNRTSVGLVIPVDQFKKMELSAEGVYRQALSEEPALNDLLRNATREGRLETTQDWSFLADRQTGENWLLVGESAGFADPILSAGVTMAQIGAQQAAYTILEIFLGELNSGWLKEQFERRQTQRINTHISFGDYWYTANAQFKDLKEFTSQLARENGLELTPEKAWAWLAQGGFIDEDLTVGVGGFHLLSVRSSKDFLADLQVDSPLEENNVVSLDLKNATWQETAAYGAGRVTKSASYVRNGKTLPLRGHFGILVKMLQQESRLPNIAKSMEVMAKERANDPRALTFLSMLPEAMEGMIRDGWLKASYDPSLPLVKIVGQGAGFHLNRDTR